MELVNGLFRMKGKVGNTIFFERNGKMFAKRAPTNVRDANTPRQQAIRSRFRVAVRFYQRLKETPLREILNVSAKGIASSGYCLFMKMNLRAFGVDGKIDDFSQIQLAAGKREGVHQLMAEVDAEDRVTLRWNDWGYGRFAGADDQLMVVVIYSNRSFAPVLLDGVSATRADEVATFSLSRKRGVQAHLYCFFTAREAYAFSNSQYVRV